MTARLYTSNDSGAPVLNGRPGSLITVLDACLVNGYGSSPAAGWTKPLSGTNKAAYRISTTALGSSGSYMQIDDTAAYEAKITGYKTMTDLDNGTEQFPNTDIFPGTLGSSTTGYYIAKTSTSPLQYYKTGVGMVDPDPDTIQRPWTIIADTRGMYLWININANQGLSQYGDTSGWDANIFFGDIISRKQDDANSCALIGGISSLKRVYMSTSLVTNWDYGSNNYWPCYFAESGDTTTYNSNFSSPTGNGKVLQRNFAGVEGNCLFQFYRNYRSSFSAGYLGSYAGPNAFPDRVTTSLNLATISLIELQSKVFRGIMPGLYEPIGGLDVSSPWSKIEGQGNFTGKKFIALPAPTNSTSGSVRVTGIILVQTNDSWYE